MKIIISICIFLSVFSLNGTDMADISQAQDSCKFKIIFWHCPMSEFENMQILEADSLLNTYEPFYIIQDKYISKYYWDEQLLLVDMGKIFKETGDNLLPLGDCKFTMILENKIVYHGMFFTIDLAATIDYAGPVIKGYKSCIPNHSVLALKPTLYPLNDIFRDFSKKDKKEFLKLNKDLYEYFKSTDRLFKGKIDLRKVLAEDSEYMMIKNAPKER
ncbi:MAG: hypothetical protein JXR46_13680 [Calditrichaceae bacterium]|nr:hypothetical protein [Calditrichaceae bacterium]MBN2710086.1 hypothetical protein [Calditrichaceae bacterium]RQV94499.1 MAG: hypothetical protein EH224_10160 [Calditrichota bacterium]